MTKILALIQAKQVAPISQSTLFEWCF